MALLDGLVAFLMAHTSITALIGSRLEPVPNSDQPPTYPFSVYYLVSGNNDYTFDRKVARTARVQIDHVGVLSNVSAVADAFEAALEGYIGLLPDGTRVLFVESVGGLTGPTLNDPAISKFSQDFLIQYSSV